MLPAVVPPPGTGGVAGLVDVPTGPFSCSNSCRRWARLCEGAGGRLGKLRGGAAAPAAAAPPARCAVGARTAAAGAVKGAPPRDSAILTKGDTTAARCGMARQTEAGTGGAAAGREAGLPLKVAARSAGLAVTTRWAPRGWRGAG